MRVFAAPFLAPIWLRRSLARSRETRLTRPNRRACSQASNVFVGPFTIAGLNQQRRAESSDKLYCIRVYVILNLFLLLSTIVRKLIFSKR